MRKQDVGQWLNRRSEDAKVCVTDLIDHMITESKKIYAGTDMMRSPSGTRTRRSSTSRTGTRGSRTASSSPWAPRAPARFTMTWSPATRSRTPGASTRSALLTSSTPYVSTARHCPYGDARRIFGQGTPKEVWHLMEQTWTAVGVPTNARITEDFSGWERVCGKIIEAKGTIVPDENFRTGRRARKMHGDGERKTKLRKRDRKSTHLLDLPVNPALMGAYEVLLEPEGGAAAEGPYIGRFSRPPLSGGIGSRQQKQRLRAPRRRSRPPSRGGCRRSGRPGRPRPSASPRRSRRGAPSRG